MNQQQEPISETLPQLWQTEWCPAPHHVRQRLTELELRYADADLLGLHCMYCSLGFPARSPSVAQAQPPESARKGASDDP